MNASKRKKKLFIHCKDVLAQAINKSIGKHYSVFISDNVTDIKKFKPNVVIFDKNTESILKNASKKIHCFYLSSSKVFSGINEVGYQSKELPNNTSKEGILLGNLENLVKQREKFLIMRLSSLFDKQELDMIVNDIKDKKTLDNRVQMYPMCPYGVVKVIDTLLSLESKGIIHLRGSEQTTRYKLGETLAELLKLNKPESHIKQDNSEQNVKLAGIVLPTVVRTLLIDLYKGEHNVR